MDHETTSAAELPEPVAGWLCLDVVNAVDGRDDDTVHTYADLVGWVARAGGLSPEDADGLLAAAAADPAGAATEVARVKVLLRAAFDVFHGLATGSRADAAALAAIQEVHADALAHGRLEPTDGTFRWTWGPDLRLPRWLVARSAVELVTAGPLGRVKVCASEEGCQYLFVDTTKNNSRRWCSMADCGNTAKARRLTEQRRARRARSGGPAAVESPARAVP